MAYIPRSSPLYDKNFKRLTKKNAVLKKRTLLKIREILVDPEIGETFGKIKKKNGLEFMGVAGCYR